jgi:formylglycine-generating enzyme required for sulfatase activity
VKGYRDGFQYTSPVGSFPTNQYGLYDMGGDVIQWCEDEYRPPGDSRVVRGASWDNAYFGGLLSSYRGNFPPDDRSEDRGFRCVVVLTSP